MLVLILGAAVPDLSTGLPAHQTTGASTLGGPAASEKKLEDDIKIAGGMEDEIKNLQLKLDRFEHGLSNGSAGAGLSNGSTGAGQPSTNHTTTTNNINNCSNKGATLEQQQFCVCPSGSECWPSNNPLDRNRHPCQVHTNGIKYWQIGRCPNCRCQAYVLLPVVWLFPLRKGSMGATWRQDRAYSLHKLGDAQTAAARRTCYRGLPVLSPSTSAHTPTCVCVCIVLQKAPVPCDACWSHNPLVQHL